MRRLIRRRDRLGRVEKELHSLKKELRALGKLFRQHQRQLQKYDQTPQETRETMDRLFAILQRLYDEEPDNRRRLAQLRASAAYARAFDDACPLVTVVLPTFSNADGLVNTSVPSVLAQTHENFELIVVADGARPEIADAMRTFDDPRIVFVEKHHRGPYPDDPDAFVRVKAVPPFNLAVRMARGAWIAPFADDDALRPHHLETLLRAAQAERYEFCYGQVLKRAADGHETVSGEWPPELGRVSLQASIYHAGLTSFIEHELADSLFRTSSDKSVLRRMVNAGVRFGFVHDIVTDYTWHRKESDR